MASTNARGRSWAIVEVKALCVAAKNASEQGGTDEKELEARVRANFKERLLYMEKIGLYPGEETGLPSAQDAVAELRRQVLSLVSNPPQPQQFSEGTAGSAVGTGSGKGSSKASDSNVEGGETVPDSGGAGGVQEAVPQEKSEVVASGEDVL
mmetsp:Transcript_27669/g.78244  ORF Transcript_27669/g.78244 Transcript_27669/m.78244 type:complete len:152 (+) Transcript_27669:1668-2123(+)